MEISRLKEMKIRDRRNRRKKDKRSGMECSGVDYDMAGKFDRVGHGKLSSQWCHKLRGKHKLR